MSGVFVWSHALAAALFAAFAAWQRVSWRDRASRALIAACLAMALWTGVTAALGVAAPASQLAESIRNFAWLSFLYALLRRGGSDHRALGVLYAVLAFAAAGNGAIDLLAAITPALDDPAPALLLSAFALRMVFAVGALVAVHNLYIATAAGARAGVGLPLAALGALWTVDLTFYALCWTQTQWVTEFAAARGIVAVVLVPLLALSAQRNNGWTIRLSRTVAFRSVGLVAALVYLGIVMASAFALEAFSGRWAHLLPTLVLVTAALLIGTIMLSVRTRAWVTVMLAKHLFAHRYDYRAEWLRFTDTLGIPGPGAPPLEVRVVKAIADIVHAPGGVLLRPTGEALSTGARWEWSTLLPPLDVGGGRLSEILAAGRIVELDALRSERGDAGEAAAIPEWIMADTSAWAIVPLVHIDRLRGAVLLERPLVSRAFDWEDFDLLRLAGRQVASYLAEANAQESLIDAARFDEFNRRFAFIMHDIKNLVSQLTLVTRNAERHANKPEFRADMIATLQSSTARMNDLLARLSQHNTGRSEEPRAVELGGVIAAVARALRVHHPVVVTGGPGMFALADPGRLEQALSHLVQNAIDASPEAEPVTLATVRQGGETGIEIIDRGPGMTADFVNGSLFKPFASTKAGGFGVGAYEARAIVAAMGGHIAVRSAPGEGTCMTLWLPHAQGPGKRIAA